MSVAILMLSFGLCGVTYAVCPCEFQNEEQLRQAYEKAQQEELRAERTTTPGTLYHDERQSQLGNGLSYWEIESGEAGIWWPLWETEWFHQ